ncbi:MAG: metal transporter [Gemmatimonadetes bacterium 13_1_40CM_4_69_8]|nr:MAG: metal transporter [Gemmatimonadetes bacterium 13_1_40CM_4_69_8]
MKWLTVVAGIALLLVVLWDAFETVVLPRRVNRRVRLTRLFYRATWRPFATSARLVRRGNRREAYLSFYGPLSLLFLLALWAAGLVTGFGLLQYAIAGELATELYMSGTTFFTLGLGDVAPHGALARLLTVVESGLGFGFLAIVIGYFPVLYQAFSRREVSISLLDGRAGSPPSAGQLLHRHRGPGGLAALERLLREWEHWSAEVLETHLSYPLLAYFRSQHNNQSWLAALTTVLDTSALMMVGVDEEEGGECARQARLTFAMARHAVVDLAQVFRTAPRAPAADRLPAPMLAQLRAELAAAGFHLAEGAAVDAGLVKLREMYEPYVEALSRYLLQPLPAWHLDTPRRDNWQTSAWDRRRVSD